jgi:3',5'-cyclic AMP phosphodiesterase CpdA
MFVLAHLSDPHLAPLPRPHLGELANKRVLGFLNWLRRRRAEHRREILDALVADLKSAHPDHIAVTGDLVNISLDAEFAQAAVWLDSLGPAENVTVIPGNHDVYVRAAAARADRYWGAFMRGDAPPAPGAKTSYPFVRRRDSIALIGLSSAIPTAPFMATGRLGPVQLQRLAEILPELEREGLFRVVLIHHPPISAPGKRFKRLLDAKAFRQVLAQHGAELVLHGHDHLPRLVWLQGPQARIPAFGVPSASCPPGPGHAAATYNLYRIDGAPGTWRCEAIARGFRSEAKGIAELARQTISAAVAPAPRQ